MVFFSLPRQFGGSRAPLVVFGCKDFYVRMLEGPIGLSKFRYLWVVSKNVVFWIVPGVGSFRS